MAPLLLSVVIATVARTPPRFPSRYSAAVKYVCTDQSQGVLCSATDVQHVYQDLPNNRSLWRGVFTGNPWAPSRSDFLVRPFPHADPATPEAHGLSQISWQSHTTSKGCSYKAHAGFPLLFTPTPHVLEKKESVDGIMCEKWSNNVTIGPPPYLAYYAVWFEASDLTRVVKILYIQPPNPMHGFPVPGWQFTYTLSNFSTAPIPPSMFDLPPHWEATCTDSDGGVRKAGLPGRQAGYLCVDPEHKANFSLALLTKPYSPVTITITPCANGPPDYCIDGLHCKDCVTLGGGTTETLNLTFTPDNWNKPQVVVVAYERSGDTQFAVKSPDYFIKNFNDLQFSTCACKSGEACSNSCQRYCGTRRQLTLLI